MKKILILLAGVAVLVTGGYLWMRPGAGSPPAGEDAPEQVAAKVETTRLRRQPLAQTIEAFGVVDAAPTTNRVISAPYDCLVRRVRVVAGGRVHAGDVLLEIAPTPDAQLALDSARSAAALARQALAGTRERYALKLATKPELLAAQQAADEARLKVASLTARGVAGDGRIVAADTGVVGRVDALAGATVALGASLLALAPDRGREAVVSVEADEVRAISTGAPVTIASVNRPDGPVVPAEVHAVGGGLDATSGSVDVRAALPADTELLAGEHVRAEIEIRRNTAALVVPRGAVLPEGEHEILFTVVNGKAVRHEVTLGIVTDDLVEVRGGGLREGDAVVTLGNYELEDGMAVEPSSPAAAGAPAEAKP